MFHLADCALSSAELDVFEDIAHVEPDGCVWYDAHKRELERGEFNACDAFLWWGVRDVYGVQRVRIGSTVTMARASWAKRIKMGVLDQSLTQRRRDLRAIFPREQVRFKVLGWHLLNVRYWQPGSTEATRILPPATVVRNGAQYLRAEVAPLSNEEEKTL
jgi:hypothetical protein